MGKLIIELVDLEAYLNTTVAGAKARTRATTSTPIPTMGTEWDRNGDRNGDRNTAGAGGRSFSSSGRLEGFNGVNSNISFDGASVYSGAHRGGADQMQQMQPQMSHYQLPGPPPASSSYRTDAYSKSYSDTNTSSYNTDTNTSSYNTDTYSPSYNTDTYSSSYNTGKNTSTHNTGTNTSSYNSGTNASSASTNTPNTSGMDMSAMDIVEI
jgi:hypothetical protein